MIPLLSLIVAVVGVVAVLSRNDPQVVVTVTTSVPSVSDPASEPSREEAQPSTEASSAPDADETEAAVDDSEPAGDEDSAAPMGAALQGTWRGKYRCGQGLTGLDLVISIEGDALYATFSFYPIPENSDIPSGAFTMTGHYTKSRLNLRQQSWLDKPSGYKMVDLSAALSDVSSKRLKGTIDSERCGRFDVKKVTSKTDHPV